MKQFVVEIMALKSGQSLCDRDTGFDKSNKATFATSYAVYAGHRPSKKVKI